MSTFKTKFIRGFLAVALPMSLLPVAGLMAQDKSQAQDQTEGDRKSPGMVQFVALDECDPTTFNMALGPDFCKNVALAAFGFATKLPDLISASQGPNPNPNWDFEPDSVKVPQGTVISVVNQGGEPHTFTEVKNFGNGFVAPLNKPGDTTAPECVGGFSTVAVAKTRIIQGSTTVIPTLSKGQHLFQCCIHPWMRVTVNVEYDGSLILQKRRTT